MDYYTPKLSHAVTAVLLGMISISAGVFLSGLALYSAVIGGLLFWIFAVVVMGLLVLEGRRQFYETISHVAEQISKLDPDRWQALGIQFPQLRVKWTGEPITFFEDTGATYIEFERFMQDSDGRTISPERNWSTGPERRRWQMIKDWLESRQYIYAESAAGNHSWLWRGDMYRILWQRYINAHDHVISDLNEVERVQV
jgi:hypothetical protein